MELHRWEDVRAELARDDPGFEEGVARKRRELELIVGLQELRKGRGASQSELAKRLGMTQANVSRIEREEDVRLSTLEKYAEALGGRVEIHVVFDGDREVVIGPPEDDEEELPEE